MGASASSTILPADLHAANDFELVIRAAKELDYILQENFHATGKDLHGKIKSAYNNCPEMTPSLVRNMRDLATLRHKLVNDRGVNAISSVSTTDSTKTVPGGEDSSNFRKQFIQRFEASQTELKTMIAYYKRNGSTTGGTSLGGGSARKGKTSSGNGDCICM